MNIITSRLFIEKQQNSYLYNAHSCKILLQARARGDFVAAEEFGNQLARPVPCLVLPKRATLRLRGVTFRTIKMEARGGKVYDYDGGQSGRPGRCPHA